MNLRSEKEKEGPFTYCVQACLPMCIGKFLNGGILQNQQHMQHIMVELVWENANAGGFVEMFVQIKNTRGYLKSNIGFHCLPHVLEAAKMFVASHVYCAEQ